MVKFPYCRWYRDTSTPNVLNAVCFLSTAAWESVCLHVVNFFPLLFWYAWTSRWSWLEYLFCCDQIWFFGHRLRSGSRNRVLAFTQCPCATWTDMMKRWELIIQCRDLKNARTIHIVVHVCIVCLQSCTHRRQSCARYGILNYGIFTLGSLVPCNLNFDRECSSTVAQILYI